MLDQDLYNQKIINAVKQWIRETIIGFNFCPFAKREFDRDTIHYELVDDKSREEQLHALANEFRRLDENPAIETTIVIYPEGLESYFDYLDFLEIANELLFEQGYEGTYQIASFHPDYCFEDVSGSDPSNYTNRSPYPLLHLIREASLEKVLDRYPDPENIPQRNITLAREKGQEVFKAILANCLKQNDDD